MKGAQGRPFFGHIKTSEKVNDCHSEGAKRPKNPFHRAILTQGILRFAQNDNIKGLFQRSHIMKLRKNIVLSRIELACSPKKREI